MTHEIAGTIKRLDVIKTSSKPEKGKTRSKPDQDETFSKAKFWISGSTEYSIKLSGSKDSWNVFVQSKEEKKGIDPSEEENKPREALLFKPDKLEIEVNGWDWIRELIAAHGESRLLVFHVENLNPGSKTGTLVGISFPPKS